MREAHVAKWKMKEVDKLAELINSHNSVGLARLLGLPSKQFHNLRKVIGGTAVIRVTRNSLITRAVKKAKKEGIEKLLEKLEGPTAMIFSNDNPFKIFNKLCSIRSSASAKPGAIAPTDIVIEACETQLPPGPALSELKGVGLKTKIDKGKIAISEDHTVLKAGEVVTPEIASVLSKLGIEPMEVKLDVSAIFENGTLYGKDVLDIRMEDTIANIQTAYMSALNLSYSAKIFTPDTVEMFIQEAHTGAKNLAVFTCIPTKDTIETLLSKGYSQMKAIESKVDFSAAPAKEKEEKAEPAKEKPVEVKKEEEKKEAKPEEKPAESKREEKAEPAKEKPVEVKKEEEVKGEEKEEKAKTAKEEKKEVKEKAEPAKEKAGKKKEKKK